MRLHFWLIRIFADMQNFNHASHVCPLAIVCVHQAKCWLRMKGLFPSVFNESVCCMLTKRPTPIHLDFLHVVFFFFMVCVFLLGSFAKSLQSTKFAPLKEVVLV